MCARYTFVTTTHDWAAIFDLRDVAADLALTPRYNVAPSQQVPVVGVGPNGRSLRLLTWGFLPSWSKEGGQPFVNARAESIFEKPTFRAAARTRRALMLADGFYEWRTINGLKQPVLFQRKDGEPFAFAAIWERFAPPDAPPRFGAALLTTEPNAVVAPVHTRMPVILHEPAQWDLWLDPNAEISALQELFKPSPDELLRPRAVNRRLNNARFEGPDCWTEPE